DYAAEPELRRRRPARRFRSAPRAGEDLEPLNGQRCNAQSEMDFLRVFGAGLPDHRRRRALLHARSPARSADALRRLFLQHAQIPGWEDVKDAKGKVLGRRGPQVTSADFIFAWKRIADFHVESPQYANIFQQGKIVGLEDWWEYTKNSPENQIDWDRPIAGLL